ncbi:MAG: hypothetical protein H0U82_05205, partial [Actinobacteria bacterium]|nr:hypothetical protein [Actinomycetota bacterium]
MTIDSYLAELERRLPRMARRRILAEAQEHLRDSAERHGSKGLPPHIAEAAAVADFGPVEIVAPTRGAGRDSRYPHRCARRARRGRVLRVPALR